MLINFWLIFNHSYNEKWILVNILLFKLQFSAKQHIQASVRHCVDRVDTSIWRLLEVH
ncbi:hypothetical protein Pint_01493 [Pistacia integerrima]|uniref:Uncharacterized protein n=2 Tax=Pistacia TaxID=55512 RepID=A0ACC1CAN2_9ROSI|nr:hypothetical protein Pint_01493 [Pistacia integerrima]KAJ0112699.1 hypothetical protein Patl1_01533 [Pistacia atlantica]